MHRVLRIHEILQNIFSHFDPPVDYWDTCPGPMLLTEEHKFHQAMRHCALTCTAFLELGLDILWKKLVDLDPILGLLPEHCIKENGEWKLIRVPEEQDWARVKVYAPRVQCLWLYCTKPGALPPRSRHPSPPYRSKFSVGFLHSLSQRWMGSNDGGILPRLRTFLLTASESSDFDGCPMFMMSGLNTINLKSSYAKSDINVQSVDVLFNSITNGPSRQTLHNLSLPGLAELTGGYLHKSLPDSFLRMLCSLDALSFLEFPRGMLDGEAFLSLRSYLGDAATFPKRITFPTLRSLSVPLLEIRKALSVIKGRNAITSVYTWLGEALSREPDTSGAYNDFALVVSKDCPHITTLDIGMYNWPREETDPEKTIQTALAPLLSGCKLLSDVCIRVASMHDKSRLNPSDQDFLAISRSWPLLRRFVFGVQGSWSRERRASRATLQGALESFATHCHELETLALRANFCWNSTAGPPTSIFASLRILDLEDLMISNKLGKRSQARRMGKHEVVIWKYVTAIANRAIIRVADQPGATSSTMILPS